MPVPEGRPRAAIFEEPPRLGAAIRDLRAGTTMFVPGTDLGEGGTPREIDGSAGIYGGPDAMEYGSFGAMTEVDDTGQYPFSMNCKLIMGFDRVDGGRDFFACSGAMIDAEVVLTAAHCVTSFDLDHQTDPDGFWADVVYVLPAWDGQGSPGPPDAVIHNFGWATASHLGADTSYLSNQNVNRDFGVIGITRAAGVLTGWLGLRSGRDCPTILGRTYSSCSFPVQSCGEPGWHDGRRMLCWSGRFDRCVSSNEVEIKTVPGCLTAVWGGMSGSVYYHHASGGLLAHAVTSISNRSSFARMPVLTGEWVDFLEGSFIPTVRGSEADLQPLDCDFEPGIIPAGGSFDILSRHLATNPTDGDPPRGTYSFDILLSTDADISSSDTLLSSQSYEYDFDPMSSVRIYHDPVMIPAATAPGTYFVGVRYIDSTDIDPANNETDGWDAVKIVVTPPEVPAVVNLKVNGQDLPGRVVSTSGPTELTLSVDPGTDTGPMLWLLGVVIGENVFWFTTTGVSLTPGALLVSPALALDDTLVAAYGQPAGLDFLWVFLLVDANGIRASDFIVARS